MRLHVINAFNGSTARCGSAESGAAIHGRSGGFNAKGKISRSSPGENNVTWPFQTEIFHFNVFESMRASDDYLLAMAYRVSRKAQVTNCKCEISFRKAHPKSIPRLIPEKMQE